MGRPVWDGGLARLQICAVRSEKAGVETIHHESAACKQPDARHFILQGVHGRSADKDNRDRAGQILKAQGVGYANAMRTWIYFPELLDWDDESSDA